MVLGFVHKGRELGLVGKEVGVVRFPVNFMGVSRISGENSELFILRPVVTLLRFRAWPYEVDTLQDYI